MNDSTRKIVAEELQNLAEDLKEMMDEEALANNPKIKALRSKLDDLGDQVRDVVKDASYKTKRAAQVADDYAHEEPWRLIGAGVVVGVVIGLLVGRR